MRLENPPLTLDWPIVTGSSGIISVSLNSTCPFEWAGLLLLADCESDPASLSFWDSSISCCSLRSFCLRSFLSYTTTIKKTYKLLKLHSHFHPHTFLVWLLFSFRACCDFFWYLEPPMIWASCRFSANTSSNDLPPRVLLMNNNDTKEAKKTMAIIAYNWRSIFALRSERSKGDDAYVDLGNSRWKVLDSKRLPAKLKGVILFNRDNK